MTQRPTLAAALAPFVLLGAASAQSLPTAAPAGLPDAVRGESAVALLDDQLPGLATRLGIDRAALNRRLLDDESLWVTPDARLYHADPRAPAGTRQDGAPPAAFSGTIELADAFTLHSRPGSSKVIHLDFDGHHSRSNLWGHNIEFPAWNDSGTSASFSDGELASIIAHWRYVAEDFAPFDVDVTTEEPAKHQLTKKTADDTQWGVRCVMTQPTDGFGDGIGGVALLSTFDASSDTPVFVFNKGDNNGSMSASHEVGHAFGLLHDGLNGSSYHPGTGSGNTSWGPIMGAPFGKNVVHFSNGDYAGATTNQDDLALITSSFNGVLALADDHADGLADAVELASDCASGGFAQLTGVINDRDDSDAFRFTTSGGAVSISAVPHAPGPDLDIRLELYSAAGALLASDEPTNDVDAQLTTDLAAGSYVVVLDGVGKAGVYSDYGSVGQYTLVVVAPSTIGFHELGGGLAGTGGQTPALSGSGVPCALQTITIGLAGAKTFSTAWLTYGLGAANVPFKGGVLIPDVAAPGGFVPVPTGAGGGFAIPSTWPAGVPAGTSLWMQAWVQDPAGPAAFAASNGLELLTP